MLHFSAKNWTFSHDFFFFFRRISCDTLCVRNMQGASSDALWMGRSLRRCSFETGRVSPSKDGNYRCFVIFMHSVGLSLLFGENVTGNKKLTHLEEFWLVKSKIIRLVCCQKCIPLQTVQRNSNLTDTFPTPKYGIVSHPKRSKG